MSIRLKVITIIVSSLVVLGVVFVSYAVSVNRESRRTHIENVTNSLKYECESVNKSIRELERNAIDLALAGRTYYTIRESIKDDVGERLTLENFDKLPLAVGGGIWYERFHFRPQRERYCFYVCRDKEMNLSVVPSFNSKEYDYPTQSWYVEIKAQLDQKKEIGWSDTYFDDLGTHVMMVTVGAAIYDIKGKFVGMSTLDWEIQKVVDRLSSLCPTPGSYVTLADPRFGKVVADTHFAKGNASASAYGKSIDQIQWRKNIPDPVTDRMTVTPLVLNRIEYLVFARELDNGMQLFVQVPDHELNGFIEHRNRLALIGAIVLTIGILAFALYFITMRVNRPLNRLMRSVKKIGAGELDSELEVSGRDELALLASTFNRMIANLKKHIEHLKEVTAAKERIESELQVAQEIQRGILPKILPPFPKCNYFEIDALLDPARHVGGDRYDFFLLSPTKVCLVIGDVSGKGIPASLFMAVTQTLHRGLAHEAELAPSNLVTNLNQTLCNNNSANMFVTYIFAVLDLTTGILTYCNAGHNPFFVLRRDGTVNLCREKNGIALGIRANRPYTQSEIKLEAGDSLYLYTDGIPEGENAKSEFFGMDRLSATLSQAAERQLSPMAIDQLVSQTLSSYVQNAEQSDDVTMLTLKITALAPAEA
ncbi:MAG: SpoIIE family protein phosphatase [Planctomycetia bacterium]|nr:SpoIIE family protein phosphatase [Planctomycetia bacterium]